MKLARDADLMRHEKEVTQRLDAAHNKKLMELSVAHKKELSTLDQSHMTETRDMYRTCLCVRGRRVEWIANRIGGLT